jgi:hypothetical protein
MGVAAPVVVAEMSDWTALGGGNSGIVGDVGHTFGFHLAASEVGSGDYSRWRDPNGSDGPYVNWSYACAGDFSHRRDEGLRAKHRDVLARLMRGELPMICEFIGQPWADQPVYYWARWNGVGNLQRYSGSGHDHWSHISWYRSKVDQRAYLWTSVPPSYVPVLRRSWPSYMPSGHWFGHYLGPNESHGGWYANERPDCKAIQERLNSLGFNCGTPDGILGNNSVAAITAWQKRFYASSTSYYGQFWSDDWAHLFTY